MNVERDVIMEQIQVAMNVVLPVFIIIGIGYFLKYRKIINDEFVQMTMKVIFNVCLPAMLFSKVSQVDTNELMSQGALKFLAYVLIMTMIIFFLSRLVAKLVIKEPSRRGTFVQGSFRSNYVILGYSILHNMLGDVIIGRMALLVLVIVPLYNILSIWVLSVGHENERSSGLKKVFGRIVRNPLIIGILLGFIINLLQIRLPVIAASTVAMLGSIGTPLGLLGIGAYMDFTHLKNVKEALQSTFLKIVLFPLLVTLIAYGMGFGYIDLAIIFVLFGSPAAISSFIMATALDGDGRLAANIVIISTGLSLITFILGLSLIGGLQ